MIIHKSIWYYEYVEYQHKNHNFQLYQEAQIMLLKQNSI